MQILPHTIESESWRRCSTRSCNKFLGNSGPSEPWSTKTIDNGIPVRRFQDKLVVLVLMLVLSVLVLVRLGRCLDSPSCNLFDLRKGRSMSHRE